MVIDISQFHKVFFEECKEHLDEMEHLLLKLNVENPDLELLNAIFRAAHSIKGGSATFGFDDMTKVAHTLESLLDNLRRQEILLQTEMIDMFLQATDVIKTQLECHIKGKPAKKSLANTINKLLTELSGDSAAVKPAQAMQDESGDDDGFGLFEPMTTSDEPEIQEELEADALKYTQSLSNLTTEATSIRVDVKKVDQLINLVGELVITHAMLNQSLKNAPADLLLTLSSNLSQLERHTQDLQEAAMSIRMMPISGLFNRFPRLVHDLAAKLKKEVELVTIGEDTELDKSLIEKIADPLTHLIRNSLDHGIEPALQRKAAGKAAKGRITLSAMHFGGNIIIDVIDDGAGFDHDRIIKKAEQLEISIPKVMTNESLWEIISAPGFSTAETITDISGRGVGMDVVNRNITEMGGQIKIQSIQGQGCTTSIQLPLTLAIIDGMSVAIGESSFIIPLSAIIETLQPKQEDLKTLAGGGCSMIQIHDDYIPLIAMHQIFNIETKITAPHEGMLVIVEAQGKKAALFVDELVAQHQIVLKSLESNYRKVPYVSSATIMGDGRVALILDVSALVKVIGQANSF